MTIGENTELWNISKKFGFYTLAIPEKIGGRYSVFTQAGLFPLYLAGVDIDELHKGAREMIDECLSSDKENNLAIVSAISIYFPSEAVTISILSAVMGK